jgi:3-oxoacyl-[acyl-carrier protein] reductase
MTDHILALSQNRFARKLVARAKLPIPLPERLERVEGPLPERVLEDQSVLVAGQGALGPVLARTLARSGASPLLASPGLEAVFAGPADAFGRHTRTVTAADADEQAPRAIVFDATGLAAASDLKRIFEVYQPWARALAHHGRSLILARPPETARSVEQAAARAALDGFHRSLAKEIGGKAATSNVLYVDEGAEDRLPAVVRFFLSKASAFVTAQSLRVNAKCRWDGDDPWTQPLAGKVALVTGAARGIGEATARVLACEGAHVVCLDRPEDDEALSTVARDVGGSLLLCNVLDADTPRRIVAHLLERHGGVDVVVHNAGVTGDRTLGRMTEELWDQVLGINLEAVLRITAALCEEGLRDGGRIVSLSSIAGLAGNNGQTNYGASKAAILGFTRKLADELAPRGIAVNAVAPGFIETRMTAAVPVVVREVGRRLSALGQGGLPEDVARAIAFLASPGAAGVTGNALRICGGALLGA